MLTPRCSAAKRKALSAKFANSGRTILTEYESKQLLKAYDIPTVETRMAAYRTGSVAKRRKKSAIRSC